MKAPHGDGRLVAVVCCSQEDDRSHLRISGRSDTLCGAASSRTLASVYLVAPCDTCAHRAGELQIDRAMHGDGGAWVNLTRLI